VAETTMIGITAVRLELLTDKRLPAEYKVGDKW